MALGDYLGSHQNVEIAVAEIAQDVFELALAGYGIAVEPRDARLREFRVQFILNTLRTQPKKVDVFTLTFGADARDFLGVSAIVAEQAAISAMPRQGDGAVDALHARAAGTTGHMAREAPTVEQHHRLLVVRESVANGLEQGAGKRGVLAGFEELLPHVNDVDFRQRAFGDTVRKFEQRVLAGGRVIAALQAGGCGAENHTCVGRLRPDDCHIAPVVAGRLFLLIARVMLLVYDDQPEVLDGREHAGTRSHYDAGATGANAPPLVRALGVAESAVEDRHAVSEPAIELARHRGR